MPIRSIMTVPDHFNKFNPNEWVGMASIEGFKIETNPLKVTLYLKSGRTIISTDPDLIQEFKTSFEAHMKATGGTVHF